MWILNVGFAYESWFTKIYNIWIAVKKIKKTSWQLLCMQKNFIIQQFTIIQWLENAMIIVFNYDLYPHAKRKITKPNTDQEY